MERAKVRVFPSRRRSWELRRVSDLVVIPVFFRVFSSELRKERDKKRALEKKGRKREQQKKLKGKKKRKKWGEIKTHLTPAVRFFSRQWCRIGDV